MTNEPPTPRPGNEPDPQLDPSVGPEPPTDPSPSTPSIDDVLADDTVTGDPAADDAGLYEPVDLDVDADPTFDEAAASATDRPMDPPPDGAGAAGDAGEGAAAWTAPDPGPGAGAGGAPPPPAGAAPGWAPGGRRLVRDPYSRLGGVASGLAHYVGIDVSIMRILFLLVAFGTGFGFFAYLLAWIIIPRADYWPPAPGTPRPFRSLTRRDLGLGMAIVGLLIALAFGGGITGSFLVPLILVGGGVWLLLQPASATEPAFATAAYSPPTGEGDVTGPMPAGDPVTASAYAAGPYPTPTPVPPPKRRRWVLGFVFGVLALFIILPILAIVGLIIAAATGNIEANFDAADVEITPNEIEDFPVDLSYDGADLTLDLSEMTPADFAELDSPAQVDIQSDFGSIEVIVPDDLDVAIEGSTSFGDIQVFDRQSSGIDNDIVVRADNPDIEMDLDIDFGEIRVVRP
ncbi:MAG: PspC domain-containing protein [Actinomycetota bacterium]